jgi:hypothetical protein
VRILLDHWVDWRLKRLLPTHEVKAVHEMGLAQIKNGKLLTLAQAEFDVFLTVDRNLQYQQSVQEYSIAVVVLVARDNRLQTLSSLVPQVEALLSTVRPGWVYQIAAQ